MDYHERAQRSANREAAEVMRRPRGWRRRWTDPRRTDPWCDCPRDAVQDPGGRYYFDVRGTDWRRWQRIRDLASHGYECARCGLLVQIG